MTTNTTETDHYEAEAVQADPDLAHITPLAGDNHRPRGSSARLWMGLRMLQQPLAVQADQPAVRAEDAQPPGGTDGHGYHNGHGRVPEIADAKHVETDP